MSITIETTERELRMGILKLGLTIACLLIAGTFLVSLVLPLDSGLSYVPVEALLFAIAFSIITTGVRSFLSILDWFEARRLKRKTP